MASAAYRSGHFDPATDSMFNPAAFSVPDQFSFGTLTPTEATVRDFPWPNEDMSLIKEWRFKEAWNLNFRADFINIFNRVVFGAPGVNFSSGQTFGVISTQVNSPRRVQLGAKLYF